MARSETISGMGRGLDIVEKLAKAVVEAGGREEEALHFLTTPAGQEALTKIGHVVVDVQNRRELQKVVVKRRITIQEAIALGGYDEVDPRIEQLFELKMSDDVIRETIDIYPFCFYYQLPLSNTECTIATLQTRGYRPGGIAELLALGAIRGEYSAGLTFALGSHVEGLVPYIDSDWLPYDEAQCDPQKRCLRLVEASDVGIAQHECDRRNPSASSYRHFVLAVRE